MTSSKRSMAVALLFVLLTCANIANADAGKSSINSENAISANKLAIRASELSGDWLFDGKKLSIIKTSMTNENILTIENSSDYKSLNMVIPSLEFTVIAKNNFLFSKPVDIDEDNSGKKLLWIEPMSSLTIAFRNDLANTPLQAIVSVTKKSKKVIAIFGPDQSAKFNLSGTSVPASKAVYTNYGFIAKKDLSDKGLIVTDFDLISSKILDRNQLITVNSGLEGRHIRLSKPVFVPYQNSEIGGSKFWTRNLYISPNSRLQFIPQENTSVIGAK